MTAKKNNMAAVSSDVLAMIQGEVVRVMLLFYLAPLWTRWRKWTRAPSLSSNSTDATESGEAMLVASALYTVRLEASAHG